MRRLLSRFSSLAVVVILVATLTPTGTELLETTQFCLICGDRGLADALLNVFLFLPFGLALAHQGVRLRRVLLVGALLSATIELAQLVIPGRDSSPGDVVFNTAGTAIGWLIMRARGAWLAPEPARSRLFALTSLITVFLVLWTGSFLLKPDFPERYYYGQWTPLFGNLEHYDGQILVASIGDIRIRSDRIKRSAEARMRLAGGVPLRVLALAGNAPVALAPIFNIYDDIQREVMLLAADGHDFVLRYRPRAASLRLDQPAFRLPRAFDGIRAGDTLRIQVQRVAPGFCVQVNTLVACPLGYTVANVWMLVGATDRAIPFLWIIDHFWLMLLFAPAGFWATSKREAILAAAVAITGLIAVSFAGSMLLPFPSHLLAAVLGITFGWLLRTAQRRRERSHATLDPRIAVHEH